jgi:tetratricopeptide (TPR) repeat protein
MLDRVVRANPDFADAVLLWAQVNLQAGHSLVAVSVLERLLQERPGFSPAQLLLADAYRAAGRLDDAVAIAREQIQLSPNSAEVYRFLGSVQQQQNKVEEARKSYEKAVELAPNDPSQVNALLGLTLEQKRYDLASQLAREQLTKNPNSAASYYMEARVEAAQKNWNVAEVALKKAVELDPSLTPAYDLLVSVFLSAGKLSDATNELEEVLRKSPENVNALTLIALTYQKAKDYPKAREAYERLLSLRPDHAPALNNLAYLYSEHFNDPDKALALAQKARGLRPADPSVADTLGWIDYQRGDYQQALRLFQESAAKLPEDTELQFHLGMANYMMGQTEAARAALQRATQATIDFPGRAEAKRRLELLGDDAAQSKTTSPSELERLAEEFPNDVVILSRLGRAYAERSTPEKAAVAYERALKVNPKLGSAAFELAKLYADPLHDFGKGLALAKAARELAPADQEVALLVAQLAYKTGNYSWALSLLREAARQRPPNSEVFHSLAWAAYALGNVPESRQAMQRLLEANPNSTQGEDAKTFLAMTSLAEARNGVEAAEAEVRGVLQARPNYVPALMVEADLEINHHQPAKAANIYHDILLLYPEFAPAKKRLAVLYSQDPQHLDQAYELAMNARERLPDDAEIRSILGRISYERKDYRSAIQYLEQGDPAQSADSENLYYLGMAHVGAGHTAQGLVILKRALSSGLQMPLSAEAKEIVAKLQERH